MTLMGAFSDKPPAVLDRLISCLSAEWIAPDFPYSHFKEELYVEKLAGK